MVPAENPLDPCQGRWSEPGTDAPATVFGTLTGGLDKEWPSESPSLAGSRFELTIDVAPSSWRVWEPQDPSACANAATWWLPDAHAEVRLPEGTSDAVGLAQVYVADGGSGEASMVGFSGDVEGPIDPATQERLDELDLAGFSRVRFELAIVEPSLRPCAWPACLYGLSVTGENASHAIESGVPSWP